MMQSTLTTSVTTSRRNRPHAVALADMSRPRNTAGAAMLLAVITGMLAGSPPVHAQMEAAPVVDWAHVRRAHAWLEDWITTGSVPEAPTPDTMRVDAVAGVRVTLRWSGRAIGSSDFLNTDLPTPPPIDLVEVVRRAGAEAIQQVAVSLRKRADDSRGSDSAKSFDLSRIAPVLLIDLQVAWQPKPILLPRGATAADLRPAYAPGYHGLIAQGADPDTAGSAWIWPATALAMNLRPPGQVRSLLSNMASRQGRSTSLDDLRFFRFRVIHYVRPTPYEPRTRLIRGNIPLPPRAVVGPDLEAATAMLADHLLMRQREDGSFVGTFHPTTSRFDPDTAIPGEAALITYSLSRRLQRLCPPITDGSTSTEPADCAALRTSVTRAIRHLAPPLADPREPMDPSAASLLVLALTPMHRMPDAKVYRDRLVARLLALQSSDGMFRVAPPFTARSVKPTTQSLALLALMACHRQSRDGALPPAIERGRMALWNVLDSDLWLATLPWSAMLAMTSTAGISDAAPLPAAVHGALDELDGTLAEMQITDASMEPHDMFGGYAFDRRPSTWPSADWRTAAMLAYNAVRLRHTPDRDAVTQRDALIGCGRAARFLSQLMFNASGCYYALDPGRMVGAVRSALWDNRLAPDRTAMTLLAMTELQDSLTQYATASRQAASDAPAAAP